MTKSAQLPQVLRKYTPSQLHQIKKDAFRILAERHLLKFVELMWPVVEPARQIVPGWPMEAICEHLEAVERGDLLRLLITVPPGFMKSLICDVFYPAWLWGPRKKPSTRFVAFSYSQSLTIRDNIRFRRIVSSDIYRENWGGVFQPAPDQFNTIRVANNKTGWKLATSVGGVGTGERGDCLLIDDPNSVQEAESDVVRASTNTWFREVLPDRLNDLSTGSIIVIQQRTHENDVAGVILEEELGYEHLSIPMRFEADRKYTTAIGWTDPRDYDGELAWPDRFPEAVLADLERTKGQYAWSAQYQQRPAPRGGGIFKRQWWKLYPEEGEEFGPDGKPVRQLSFPPMEYIVASVDTAFTTKAENDYSACVVMGVFRDRKTNAPKIMLMHAWKARLEFHDLIERLIKTCVERKVDRLLIESKANGISVAQEIARVCSGEQFGVTLLDPKGADKVARAYAVQHLWENGLFHAPDREWAQMVIDEMATFPRGKHDDVVDSAVQAARHLRDSGAIALSTEYDAEITEIMSRYKKPPSIAADVYEV